MATNTLGEFSDGEDENVWEWSDPEADDIIRNINEEEILARVYGNASDDVIRNVNEEEILARVYGNDDIIPNIDEDEVQTGRGQKRKNEEDESDDEESTESEDEQGQYYYHLESRKKYHSKKFGMTATDHKVRFNNVLADFDLLESYESTMKIFRHLLDDVTEGMAPNDKIRFILRSEQLDTPISLPFMTVDDLTTERVFSQIERVIQSNQEFRLNDTVTIGINHVKTPEGRGRSKRTIFNIRDHLKKKGSIILTNYLEDHGFEVVQKWECELKKELKEDEEMKQFFDKYEIVDPLQPRDAFYGGRTNATKLFHECQGNEKIK